MKYEVVKTFRWPGSHLHAQKGDVFDEYDLSDKELGKHIGRGLIKEVKSKPKPVAKRTEEPKAEEVKVAEMVSWTNGS